MGDSNHLGVFKTKVTRTPLTNQRTVRKRQYKGFCPITLWQHLLDSQVNQQVENAWDLEEADKTYHREILYGANKMAPLKITQVMKHFQSGLTQETKDTLAIKKQLTRELQESGDPQTLMDLKAVTKLARENVRKDREAFWRPDLGPNPCARCGFR